MGLRVGGRVGPFVGPAVVGFCVGGSVGLRVGESVVNKPGVVGDAVGADGASKSIVLVNKN